MADVVTVVLEGRVQQQQSETTGEKGALVNTIIAS